MALRWRQAPRRELGGKGKKGGGGKDDGEKEMLYFDPKGSSKENSKVIKRGPRGARVLVMS